MPPAPSAAVEVSVVVVTWNGLDLTRRCLASLADPSPAGHHVEFIVVDNGSDDGTVEALRRERPDAQVISSGANLGFGGGANLGIRAARGDIVVLLNNDAVAAPGYLDALVAPFAREGAADLGAVTGRVLLDGRFSIADATATGAVFVGHDGTRWRRDAGGRELVNSTGNEVTWRGNGRDRDWLADADTCHAPPDVLGFVGGSVALSRRALDDVGLFDEHLFMYYEDTELSWRLRRRGWRVEHADDAVTWHRHAASSSAGSDFFLRHNERNRLVFAVMHCPWRVVALALVSTVVNAVRRPGRRRRLGAALLGALRLGPYALRARRTIDRHARVPRRAVADYLVPEKRRP